MAHSATDVQDLFRKYVCCAEAFMTQCHGMSNITGAHKLEKKCRSELVFLKSLPDRIKYLQTTMQENHLRCSNLSHFAGILHAAEHIPIVSHLLHPFSLLGRTQALYVDVVAGQDRHIWVKVIARKAQGLHLVWAGQGQYGERDLVKQGAEYIECAEAHPVNFSAPQVHFAFYNGVTYPMAEALEQLGVIVLGQRLEVDREIEEYLQEIDTMFDTTDSESHSDTSEDYDLPDKDSRQNDTTSDFPPVNNTASVENQEGVIDYCVGPSNLHSETNRANKLEAAEDCSRSLEHFKLHPKCDTNVCDIQPRSDHRSVSDRHRDRTHVDAAYEDNSDPDPIRAFSEVETNDAKSGPFVDTYDAKSGPFVDTYDAKSGPFVGSICVAELITMPPNFSCLNMNHNSHPPSAFVSLGMNRVNLDITALITLVSAVTHGRFYFEFEEEVLTQQAAEERKCPVLAEMQNYLKDKELFACETAVADFRSILETLGGPGECHRARELLERVTIVPDNPSQRTEAIPNTGKIKERSKIIFGTGDELKAITMTANSGFVRAAKHQGVEFAVYTHPSRALTEQKEKHATAIT